MDKAAVVAVLDEIGTLLDLKGENRFKVLAYHNAARSLETEAADLPELLKPGRLEEVRGVGEAIAQKVRELAQKGRLAYYQDLKASTPPGLLDMLRIQGLGPKRVKALHDYLGIKSLDQLEKACRANRLAGLEGFGEKSQENILKGLEQLKQTVGQSFVSAAAEQSQKLLAALKRIKGVKHLEVAGSLRRRREVVGDIDILAVSSDPAALHQAFISAPDVRNVIAHGETKSSVSLRSGMNCDLRTVSEKEFPFALQYFTGSKEHNVLLRGEIKKAGWKINEYGLYKGDSERSIDCKDEAAIYKKFGYDYIPPELREGRDELERAKKGTLPTLVELKDLRGTFHVHSTYSDGKAPLAQMIAEAERLGLDYVGISDHSQSAYYANGLKPDRLKVQRKEIEVLRRKHKIAIFWGVESDILPNGHLDYPDEILAEFDFVIGSVHSSFQLSQEEQTKRVLKAMDSKYMTFLGHPTGRLILGREGYAIDLRKIYAAAKKTGVAIEVNANPHRLDLDWRNIPEAKNAGARFSINPDAHAVEGLSDLTYGVGIARKGGLEKKDVLNTLPLPQIQKFLKSRR